MSVPTETPVDRSAGPGQASAWEVGAVPGSESGFREVSDEELVQRMREGEASAGETLCRRYHQSLMRYLHRLSHSDLSAEELHQRTWLSVLEHLGRFDPASSPGGFKAWLFRIATNKANDLWRSQARERNASNRLQHVTDPVTADARSGMEEAEQVERLRRAVERLPEPQRQVLMLRYYSGLKFIEIAQVLGCPLNTALGRMHKAILRLKAEMSG